MAKTYSFSDVVLTLSHSSLGSLSTNGMGLGQISVSMSADKTSINVASDGTPVVTKIKNETGSLSIQCQQTSEVHLQLKRWLNYLTNAPTNEWSNINAVLTSKQTGEQDVFSGGSITKHPDITYDTEAGSVTWTLQFANITQNNI